MTTASQQRFFGQQALPHTVIIARGDRVRHFTVRPWMARALALLSTCAVAGAVGSAAFVGSNGDWNALASGGDASLTAAYEIRIASLRSEVDRLTTRSFLDREKVSSKVDLLLDQQAELAQRYAKLQPLLDRARSNGLIEAAVPVPAPKPSATGGDELPMDAVQPLAFANPAGKNDGFDRFKLIDPPVPGRGAARGGETVSPDLILSIGRSIGEAESRQLDGLNLLSSKARAKADAIGTILETAGIDKPKPAAAASADAEGGPYVPVPPNGQFDAGLVDLAAALDVLQATRRTTEALPLAQPVTSTKISSTFGVRSDPFLGRAALHTGIDFAAEPGSAVRATAPGKVVFAGESGGYGLMVEVEHGNGLSTRYAHMSSIAVAPGDAVDTGATVGRVGSTGRSTGPHLHYEVRRTGEAVDPSRYLKAGRRIGALG